MTLNNVVEDRLGEWPLVETDVDEEAVTRAVADEVELVTTEYSEVVPLTGENVVERTGKPDTEAVEVLDLTPDVDNEAISVSEEKRRDVVAADDESVRVVALGNIVEDALVERTLVGAEVDDKCVTVVAGTGVEVLTVGTVAVDASVEV